MADYEADVVIVGGGTAGCVVAGRLAAACPDVQIILIEQGQDNTALLERPLDQNLSVFKAPPHFKYYPCQPSTELGIERKYAVPTAQSLGGGTAVNWMMFNNPAASDYDAWDMPGWTFEELKPFLQKTVSYHAPNDTDGVQGRSGVMPVSFGGGGETDFQYDFYRAVENAKGLPRLPDMADFKHGHGLGRIAKWISPSGKRSIASTAYLPSPLPLNLKVLTSKTVIRLSRSTGEGGTTVEICDVTDKDLERVQLVKARRKVVLSAGSFGTPLILERSGVGSRQVLERAEVDLTVELDGVGKEYQDHQLIRSAYHLADGTSDLDAFFRGDEAARRKIEDKYEKGGDGLMASSVLDVGYKVRPTDEELDSMGAEVRKVWQEVGMKHADKPFHTGCFMACFLGPHALVPEGSYMSPMGWINYSASRGSLHITSSNPFALPAFQPGYLRHPSDLRIHMWAYKWHREVARRMACYRGELATSHPPFPPTSAAACRRYESPPDPSQLEDFVYSKEDDAMLAEWLRGVVGTVGHALGTCPMKKWEDGGVVNERLNVYGWEGLMIADMSICPKNVGSNTASVALLIGEKAASLLIEELSR